MDRTCSIAAARRWTARALTPWLLAAVVGCADPSSDTARVRPVTGRSTSPSTVVTQPPRTTTSVLTTTTTAPGGQGAQYDTTPALATVAAVLQRYGRVLGELSADPAGAPAPGTPGRAGWDAVVLPDSSLSVELLERMQRRALVERVVVTPGAEGVVFRHVPTTVRSVTADAIEFDWCGWSPGIGRSIDSGEVVDDAVAHATGRGRVVRVGGDWRLASLDQFELELLAPGSADPCPTGPPAGPS